jgi:transcription elongation factor Elf1
MSHTLVNYLTFTCSSCGKQISGQTQRTEPIIKMHQKRCKIICEPVTLYEKSPIRGDIGPVLKKILPKNEQLV